MQDLLSFDQSPPLAAPLRFFLTAPLFAILAGALLLSSGADGLASRWTPTVLALTHLIAVGFMLQVMLGAMLQIMPVVAGANMARPLRVAAVVHAALSLGTLVLVAAFLTFSPMLFKLAAIVLGAGVAVFVVSATRALHGIASPNPTIEGLKHALAGPGGDRSAGRCDERRTRLVARSAVAAGSRHPSGLGLRRLGARCCSPPSPTWWCRCSRSLRLTRIGSPAPFRRRRSPLRRCGRSPRGSAGTSPRPCSVRSSSGSPRCSPRSRSSSSAAASARASTRTQHYWRGAMLSALAAQRVVAGGQGVFARRRLAGLGRCCAAYWCCSALSCR